MVFTTKNLIEVEDQKVIRQNEFVKGRQKGISQIDQRSMEMKACVKYITAE